jgi:hypothetical protein
MVLVAFCGIMEPSDNHSQPYGKNFSRHYWAWFCFNRCCSYYYSHPCPIGDSDDYNRAFVYFQMFILKDNHPIEGWANSRSPLKMSGDNKKRAGVSPASIFPH